MIHLAVIDKHWQQTMGQKSTYEEAKLFSVMKEEMSWEKLKEPMMGIYLKHYTAKELQDMVTFYKSETGKSMTSKIPLVMSDSMAVTQAMMKDFLPKMQAINKQIKEELAESRKSTN